MEMIILTTPTGKIAITKEKITVISEEIISDAENPICSKIYIDGDESPFNILETFDEVVIKLCS